MATKIVTKNSSTASAVPTASDLVQGELAVNVADKRLFTEDNTGTIVELGTNPSTLAVDTDTLYVDSTNNRVGIGTTSPSESIHTTGNIRLGDSAPAELYSNSSELRFGVDKNNDNGTSNITFYVDNSEKMRIDSSGKVGIGTTSPSEELELASSSPTIRLTDTNDSTYGSVSYNVNALMLNGDNTIRCSTDGSERLRIDSSGNVGIGTTSPAKTLTVAGTGLRVQSTASADFYSTGQDALIVNNGTANLRFWNNGSERMRIDSSGRVLLNKTAATGSLTLESQAPSGFSIGSGFYSSATGSTIEFKDSNTTANYKVRIGAYTDDMVMFAGGSERMRIDSSGNVGIGTASADEALEVSGDVKSSGGNFGIYHFGETSDVTKIVGRDGGHGSFPNTMDFFTNSTQRMRIDSSGNVGIGTSSPVSTLEIAKNDQTNGATLSITNSFNGSSWDAGDTVGSLDFRIDDSSTTEPVRGKIKVFDDTASGNTYPYASAMSFTTTLINTSIERMRIQSNGVVLFAGGISENAETLSGTSTTIDLSSATNFTHNLVGNTTYTFSNPAASGSVSAFTLKIRQDTSARTITWPSSVDWAGGTAPTLTSQTYGIDIFTFFTLDGGTTYYGFVAGQAMS